MMTKAPGYVSEYALSRMLGVSIWTLRAWRQKSYGPAHVKFGRAIFYPEAAVDAFLANPSAANG